MLEAASLRRSGVSRFAQTIRIATALLFAVVLPGAAFAIIGVAEQIQLGNPSGATTDGTNHVHYLIQRAQYAMDYNDNLRVPNWVSWDLTSGDVGGSGRSSFITDNTLPAGFTVISTSAYSGSGYDRGHMCPSADRTVDSANNQPLFYMTNMVPQAPDNNQGVWANFETECRNIASAGNELLITCGGSGYTSTTIGTYNVAVPGAVWKVVVVVPLGSGTAVSRITSSTRVIAISIPNINGIRSDPWQNYLTSPAAIESATGLTFFTGLDVVTRANLRVKIDGQTSGGPVIIGQPTNQLVAVGTTATFSVSATGTGTLSYQWYHDNVAIGGATASTLEVANAQPADMGNYRAVVTDSVASASSNVATLTLIGGPQITTQPNSLEVLPGSPASFTVVATGNATLTYQWYLNDAPISGATNPTYSITNVQAADLGSYDVTVTNGIGSVTSATADLSLAVAPTITVQPQPKAAVAGTTATFSVTATGTAPLSYLWYKGVDPIGSATSSTLSISNVQAADVANYHVVVSNIAGFATSNDAALTITVPPPVSTIYWDFATASPTSGLPGTLTGGTLTQGNNNGTTTLITAISVSSGYTGVSGGNNAGAATKGGALDTTASGSTYFAFTLTPTAGTKFVATGLKFGSRSTSTGPQAYAVFSSADNYATAVASGTFQNNSTWVLHTPVFTPVTGVLGAPVTFRIYGYNGSGNISLNTAIWRIDDLKLDAGVIQPPSITTHPVTQTGFVAGNVSFTVAAMGTATLTYQWRKDTVDIPGATTDTLTLNGLQFSNAGSYDVVVTNSAGTATSNAATLTILETFETWAALAGLTAPDDAPTADPNGNGVPNLVEYALGRSPVGFDPTPLPTVTIEGGQMVFRFTKPKWVSGLTYTVEGSTDLATWTPVSTSVESSTATTETLIATLPLDQAKRFMHLKVTR